MRIVLMFCAALLILAVIILQQSSGLSPSQALGIILLWPLEQQLAAFAMASLLVLLLALGIWQANKIDQQGKAVELLSRRLHGLRDEMSIADDRQKHTDNAVGHLVGTDPLATIEDIKQRLDQAEAQTSVQEGQNEAIDLQTRLDEIRRRQQALRVQLGSVSEKRRATEPMLQELKERQTLLERSLSELEKDDTGKSLHARLEDAESFLNRADTRLNALEVALGNLKQMKERGEHLKTAISPFRHEQTGIKALYKEITSLQNQLDAALLSLEKEDDVTISALVEQLSTRERGIEQRIDALSDCLDSLETIRAEVGSHFGRLGAALDRHIKR